MVYTSEEQQILQRYEALKEERRRTFFKRVFIALSVLLLFCLLILGWYLSHQEPEEEVVTPKECILELKQTELEIGQGESLNYLSYVQNATIDGESALSQVQYNEIDTSVVGTYAITYQLSTCEEDKVLVLMKVEVVSSEEPDQETIEDEETDETEDIEEAVKTEDSEKEQETEKTEEKSEQKESDEKKSTQSSKSNASTNKTNTNNTANSNTGNTSSSNSSTSNQKEDTSASQSQASTVQPFTKSFLFSDGYTMDNVLSACEAAGKQSGLSWTCSPIQDEATKIYKGMLLVAGNN